MSAEVVEKALLKKFVPMDALSDTHLVDIGRKSRVERHPRGKILFKRDERCERLHFLVSGSVDLADAGFNITSVAAGSERARSALDDHDPHAVAAVTTAEVEVLTVDKDYLDLVLTWHQAGDYVVTELGSDAAVDESDWMSCLLQSYIFSQIPPANIQQLFMKFEEVSLPAGEAVVKQGDPGDYFYVLKSGRARIVRRMSRDGNLRDVTLAELLPGDVFGEDALIGDAPRNASVIMITPGSLMRLGKEDFQNLMQNPIMQYLEFAEFENLMRDPDSKVELIDVRLPLEFKQGHIPGARSLPLHVMRQSLETLDPDTTYVTVCDGGRRSVLAAYILNLNGFDALVLKDAPEIVSAA